MTYSKPNRKYIIVDVEQKHRYSTKVMCVCCDHVFSVLVDEKSDTIVPCPACRQESTINVSDVAHAYNGMENDE